MRIDVQLFASLRDAIAPSISVEVPETQPGETDAGTLRAALRNAHPVLAAFGSRALLAVNEAHATDDSTTVRQDDVVALLPPLAGG